jgi:hypothetical protein
MMPDMCEHGVHETERCFACERGGGLNLTEISLRWLVDPFRLDDSEPVQAAVVALFAKMGFARADIASLVEELRRVRAEFEQVERILRNSWLDRPETLPQRTVATLAREAVDGYSREQADKVRATRASDGKGING